MTYREDLVNIWGNQLPWDKLNGSKILITGATGLIGSCLVECLMSCPWINFEVYALGRNEERAKKRFEKFRLSKNFHLLISDITKTIDYSVCFDFIIHAASGASPADFSNHPVEVMKANFVGVTNLIEYGMKHQMKRFLYVSSGEIYGEGEGQIITEDYSGYVNPVKPRSCYPSSKRAAETLCASYAAEYSVDVVIARPCHIYGPYFTANDNRVYAQFIRNVLNGEDIVMKSTGEQFRSWCYVVDCVTALLYILLKGNCGEAYNVADDKSNINIRDLALMTAEIGHRKVVIDIPGSAETKGFNPIKRSVFSTNKLKCLGWKIEGIMKEKMESTINQCKHYNAWDL